VSARTKARKRAIDVLYGADLRERAIADAVVEEQRRAAEQPARAASWRYAREIIEGVDDHRVQLDELIAAHAHGWTLDRMPVLDRAILRVGAWEILHNDDVPAAVAISEAVQLATELSTDDSGGFVNGVLSAIAREN
jgi:N utilization substance protein B